MKRASAAVVASLGSLVAASSAHAHSIWLTSGHEGSQTMAQVVFGDLDNIELADAKKIVRFDVVSATGREADLAGSLKQAKAGNRSILQTAPFATQSSAVLSIAYDNGYWIRRAKSEPWLNSSKLALPEGRDSNWAMKWGKALLGPGSHAVVLGTRLELVALDDPYRVPAGGKLRVRLDLEGKPFPGAKISYTDGLAVLSDDDQPTVTTGADGVANIPLTRKGPWLLATEVEAPPASRALTDTDDLIATLSFDTHH